MRTLPERVRPAHYKTPCRMVYQPAPGCVGLSHCPPMALDERSNNAFLARVVLQVGLQLFMMLTTVQPVLVHNTYAVVMWLSRRFRCFTMSDGISTNHTWNVVHQIRPFASACFRIRTKHGTYPWICVWSCELQVRTQDQPKMGPSTTCNQQRSSHKNVFRFDVFMKTAQLE